MKLIKQQGHTCFITALAMVLDVRVADIIKILGHDGQQRVADELGTKGLRGVHPQELLDVAREYGRWLVQVEVNPTIGQPGSWCQDVYTDGYQRFLNMIQGKRCIATLANKRHAIAIGSGGTVYDPAGYVGTVLDYKISCAWMLI